MADRYTEVTRTSYGRNIMNSIGGVFFGIILFVLSFPVLWWNQGRINLGKVAEESVPVTTVEAANEGRLVAATGTLTTEEQLGDPPYLKPGEYVAVDRIAEMYAWQEHSESETRDKVGGGTETTTTYTYDKGWTSSPSDSSSFRHPEGHQNPPMAVESQSRRVAQAKVGPFSFVPADCRLPVDEELTLTPELLAVSTKGAAPSRSSGKDKDDDLVFADRPAAGANKPVLDGGYLYFGRGSLTAPEVGDIRVSYRVLRPGGSVTLFGQQSGDSVKVFVYKEKAKLFRLFKSSREEAIAQLKLEHKLIGYGIGLLGFLMMWFGLSAVFGPIPAVLGVIPFMKHASQKMIGCVTFPVAVVLTFIVVMISKLFHSLIAMLIVGAVTGVLLLLFVKSRMAKQAAD